MLSFQVNMRRKEACAAAWLVKMCVSSFCVLQEENYRSCLSWGSVEATKDVFLVSLINQIYPSSLSPFLFLLE